MDQIKLYNILRKNLLLADEDAAEFISAMEIAMGAEMNTKIQALATKDNITELKTDIKELKIDIKELKTDIKELKTETRDLYKTIYLNGLVQFIAIVASVLAIVKFMR